MYDRVLYEVVCIVSYVTTGALRELRGSGAKKEYEAPCVEGAQKNKRSTYQP